MSFARDIAKFSAKAEKAADMVFRGTALDIFGKVVQRTPVDTGRLRGNWQVQFGYYPTDEVDTTPAAALRKGNKALKDAKAADVVYIVNNLPYAQDIEGGSSKQAPAGMVAVTVAEFKRAIEKQAREQR